MGPVTHVEQIRTIFISIREAKRILDKQILERWRMVIELVEFRTEGLPKTQSSSVALSSIVSVF